MPLVFASPAAFTVIDAARFWRLARDRGEEVVPVLFTRLGMTGSGLLAPVLDGLLSLFEAAFRRKFEAGALSDTELTGDEQWLIEGLDHDDEGASIGVRPELVAALRTALRSTRIVLGSVLVLSPVASIQLART
jgi:hypothetical protein